MFTTSLSDLDALVLRCRDAKARSHIAEAVTCLKAGAFRAAIVATWVAVVHDLVAKLEQLALAGDKNAQTKIDEFHRIIEVGDIKASLDFERTVLDIARDEFELFGPLAHVDLTRLRDDRHRCAHPSMLDRDTDYQPAPELARCHVVNAVTHVLQHGPAQGKAAMGRLLAELEGTFFPKNVDELVVHLEHGPLGHPRASLVRNYTIVLLKRYLADPPAPPKGLLEGMRVRKAKEEDDKRIVVTLKAVVQMHREIAIDTLNNKLDELVAQASDGRLDGIVVLVANIAEAWHALAQAQRNRIIRYVRDMPTTDFEDALAAAWSIADVRPAALQRITDGRNWKALADVCDPPRDWVQLALDQVMRSANWDDANPPREFLVPAAHLISEEQARALLAAAKRNRIEDSWGVRDTVSALSRSAHMGPERMKILIEEAGLSDAFVNQPWWPKS